MSVKVSTRGVPEALNLVADTIQEAFSRPKTQAILVTVNQRPKSGKGFASQLGNYFENCVATGFLVAAAADPDVIAADAPVRYQASQAIEAQQQSRKNLLGRASIYYKSNYSARGAQIIQAQAQGMEAGKILWANMKPKLISDLSSVAVASIGGRSPVGDIAVKGGGNTMIIECKFYENIDSPKRHNIGYFTLSDSQGHFGRSFVSYLKSQPRLYWGVDSGDEPLSGVTWQSNIVNAGFKGYIGREGASLLQFIMSKGELVSQGISARFAAVGQKTSIKVGKGGQGSYAVIRNNDLHTTVNGYHVTVTGNLTDPEESTRNLDYIGTNWGPGKVTLSSMGGIEIAGLQMSKPDAASIIEYSVNNPNRKSNTWTQQFQAWLSIDAVHNAF